MVLGFKFDIVDTVRSLGDRLGPLLGKVQFRLGIAGVEATEKDKKILKNSKNQSFNHMFLNIATSVDLLFNVCFLSITDTVIL